MKQSRALQVFLSFFAAVLISAFALGVAAQSGRRSNNPTQPAPPPVPVASPDEALPKPSRIAKPRFTLMVGIDSVDSFSQIPISAEGVVLDNCVARLSQSGSVIVTGGIRSLGRADALKKAKASSDVHVVWMRLRAEIIGMNPNAEPDAWDILVEYSIFAPTTGEVVGSGRAYAQRRGRSVIPTSKTGGITGERWYTQAGRDAAEQILAKLHLPTKPLKVP